MDEVLYLKFRQHGELRALLLGTYPAKLIYVESGDASRSNGAGEGMNELGNSLMRVRERFHAEGGLKDIVGVCDDGAKAAEHDAPKPPSKGKGKKSKANGEKLKVKGKKVTRNGEKVKGNRKKVKGNVKKVKGSDKKVKGSGKKGMGSGKKVMGSGKKARGSGEKVKGSSEKLKGKSKKSKG